jgi:glycosyltransferase involved in cell wall biosynthesis
LSQRIVNIGISFGPLRKLHDGLGEFSVQLGQRLAARAGELAAQHGIRFHFHMREERFGLFGDGVRYLAMRPVQRVLHVARPRFDLWHKLNQHIAHRAPVGTRRRLVTVHDFNYLYAKSGASLALHAFKGRRKLAGTDHVVTDTRFVADDVRSHAGFTGPVDTIHLGARSLVGDPQEAVPEVAPGSYLFHLSRMAASKNVSAILDLAAIWPEQRFVLAGPASGSVEATRAEVGARGLANVRVLPGVSDAQKAWLFANCAGFLFPSLTEGFGLPPLEAMHFGKPAFLSDRTCLPEIGGEVARYFHDFDAPSMRRVVEGGLAEARRPGRADAIRRHAARFSWDACADAYLALYLRLTAAAP